MKSSLANIICLIFPAILSGMGGDGSIPYSNQIFDSRIKTVQLYKEGWNLSYPMIKLNTPEKLVFQFDLIGDRDEAYNYTFIHCDKDWNKSDIFTNDFLDGFPENPIEDIKASFNTTTNYFHYNLIFPNDRVSIKLSGNYILYIYQADNAEKPVITQRFIIREEAVKVTMSVHRPRMTSDMDAGQQVDFNIDLTGAGIIDPYRNIYPSLLQNGRWDNVKNNMKPDIYGATELKYNSLSEKNVFPGGNEFRYFDIRSIRYQSEYVKRIDFKAPAYNIYLTPSDNREFKPYFYLQDFNGKYYIASQEGRNPETDADYVYVYFTLPSKYIIEGGDMYVSGGLSNWALDNNNRMIFNQEQGQYECTMLLKQGWYNFEYIFLQNGENKGIVSKFEGSHYETENDYLAVIYYRNPRDRYDRVIGFGSVNTLNRISY